tara:strand:- start:66 stop:518 length:453 start_codon:yes stop_codon:yes gene_type:complete
MTLKNEWNYVCKDASKFRSIRGAGGIIRKDGKYLLVFSKRFKKWSFPKGTREENVDEEKASKGYEKQSCINIAKREIEEESGLVVDIPIDSNYWFGLYAVYFFLIDTDYEQHEVVDVKEIGKTGWFTVEEIRELKVNYDIKKFIQNHHGL